MSDAISAAVIAAFSSMIASFLTFIVGIRSIRRSVSTSNGEPLGVVLEARLDRVDRRVDALDRSIGEVREWLAFREGRELRALATPTEVADYLRVPLRTLYRWRYAGAGPPAFRVGRHLRFRWADVEEWLGRSGPTQAPNRVGRSRN